MIQVVKQQLSHTGEARSLVVQSTRLDVSAVPVWCWRPGRFLGAAGLKSMLESPVKLVLTLVKKCRSSRIDKLASDSGNELAKNPSFFYILLCGLPPEGAAYTQGQRSSLAGLSQPVLMWN